MRKFSRWMPPKAEPRTTVAGWLVLAGLAAGVIAAIIAWPVPVGAVFGAWVIVMIVGTSVIHGRLRRLAAERTGEDIGTFARSFDRRSQPFDPWVVRATWDAFEPYVTFRGGCVPLRPTDSLIDLPIDPDDLVAPGPWGDLGDDLLSEVAARSGHSLDQPEANPYYGHVDTVGDFVMFVTCQPRVAGNAQRL